MYRLLMILLLVFTIISCSGVNPTVPGQLSTYSEKETSVNESSRWVWGNWTFHIPEDHNSISIYTDRSAARHFNVKMLLEKSPCDKCIWISGYKNNGDGTVSISISLRHPYPGYAYYTGFDVRGILHLPTSYHVGYFTDGFRISSLSLGDPELLNPDGYTMAYDPLDQHNDQPIFKYQPYGDLGGGYDLEDRKKYPCTLFMPFIYFYSSPIRQQFSSSSVVSRTYHLALPEGEWDYGYSVDACWAKPTKIPVENIVEDFPINANTMEAYRIDVSISGPLVGEEPSLLTMRAYKHSPELLANTSGGGLNAECLDGWWAGHSSTNPVNITDQFIEYNFEIRNLLHRPPSIYPVTLSAPTTDTYAWYIEESYWENSYFNQVFWVTVES